MRLAGELQGGGVRQGSFFPPTQTHRDHYDRLEKSMQELINQ